MPQKGNLMHPNEELIKKFYTAFQNRDAEAMAACYHPNVTFSDPVFPDLKGADAGAMWAMLLERGKDLRLEFSGVQADESEGKAHWDAFYSFSRTGNKVHNSIDASFRFQDGKIISHRDNFDFWRWSRQALGTTGLLLGWSPFLQKRVQATSAETLAKWKAGK
jgi:ketosteroid isomerase-like protein